MTKALKAELVTSYSPGNGHQNGVGGGSDGIYL